MLGLAARFSAFFRISSIAVTLDKLDHDSITLLYVNFEYRPIGLRTYYRHNENIATSLQMYKDVELLIRYSVLLVISRQIIEICNKFIRVKLQHRTYPECGYHIRI